MSRNQTSVELKTNNDVFLLYLCVDLIPVSFMLILYLHLSPSPLPPRLLRVNVTFIMASSDLSDFRGKGSRGNGFWIKPDVSGDTFSIFTRKMIYF